MDLVELRWHNSSMLVVNGMEVLSGAWQNGECPGTTPIVQTRHPWTTSTAVSTSIFRVTCAVLLSDILGLALPSPAKLQSVLAQRRTTSTDVVLLAARAMIRTAPSSTRAGRVGEMCCRCW